jgi:LPXTG-motif cell wall-anchored protein
MTSVQIIVFVAILLLAIVLFILLRKSKKKKGPLVSGEEAMDVSVNNFDG